MKSFSEMNLTLVGLQDFNVEGLYCLDDSILQNQDLFPGCYGICANPDVSGIGNRCSLYIQTILTLWLATLTPNAEDTLGAMLAAIAASFTVFVATLAQYGYNNISFHHTLITINLSNLPTIAFLAGILRLRLQPGVIPLGPKLFATPILVLQFCACAVSVFLGIGLNNSLHGGSDNFTSGRGGAGGWEVSQPQCNPDTQVIIFGRSIRFWNTEELSNLNNISTTQRVLICTVYAMIVFLPFLSSFICLYAPETGTLRAFASAFHQERRTNKFALLAFFVLSNVWAGVLIYATELQISRNNILPGENIWGSGQVLAMLLVIIPLLGCLNVALQSLGNHSKVSRRWIKRAKLHRIFGLKFESNSGTPSVAGTPRPSISRNPSDKTEKADLESGDGSKAESLSYFPPSRSPRNTLSPPEGGRRLSKRHRAEVASPEDLVIVVPGEDSGPEDSAYRKKMRGSVVSDGDSKRLSKHGSIASKSSNRSRRGSEIAYVPSDDGKSLKRVLSKRSSLRRASVDGNESDTSKRPKPRRRLSKRRAESDIEAGYQSTTSRRSGSDGYWSANDDMTVRGEAGVSRRMSSHSQSSRPSLKRSTFLSDVGGSKRKSGENSDDPSTKYYWDPERGWLEK